MIGFRVVLVLGALLLTLYIVQWLDRGRPLSPPDTIPEDWIQREE